MTDLGVPQTPSASGAFLGVIPPLRFRPRRQAKVTSSSLCMTLPHTGARSDTWREKLIPRRASKGRVSSGPRSGRSHVPLGEVTPFLLLCLNPSKVFWVSIRETTQKAGFPEPRGYNLLHVRCFHSSPKFYVQANLVMGAEMFQQRCRQLDLPYEQ